MRILQIKDLYKSFDEKQIIKGVSFDVYEGRIVGLLGKNGSGKTTIIKMLNDLLTIDSGEILIDGKKIGPETKALISYLPERNYLDKTKSISQTLTFFQDFYADFDIEKAEKLLNELELDKNLKLSKISKGMLEKLSLVLTMSRRAKLYILDEPLGGVDPATRDKILKTILSNFDENSSLIITTHLVADVEKILDEVIIINNGEIILRGEADKIREEENASINEVFIRRVQ